MGFWSKLGKIALKAGGVGAMFIPGMQPLGAAALGAGLGAASAAVDHKGLGGILAGAGMGAIPGAASKVLKGAGVLQGSGLGTRLAKIGLGAASKGAVGSLAGRGGTTVMTGSDPGDPGGSVWDEEGTYTGPSTYSTTDGSQEGSWWGRGDNALKVADIAQGSIGSYLRVKAQKDAQKQQAALYESNLDPYRNLEDQASATGRFDMMANADFTAPPTQLAGRYGAGGPIQPGPSWLPSPETRGVADLAMRQTAAGRGQAPTMTDKNNYGRATTVSYPTSRVPPIGSGQTPAALNSTLARLAARRRLPPAPPNQSWLA